MDTYSKKFQPVVCATWTPTDAAFKRYLEREVVLCRQNWARKLGGELHSERTRMEARRPSLVAGTDLRTGELVSLDSSGQVVPVIANISVRTKLDGRWVGQA